MQLSQQSYEDKITSYRRSWSVRVQACNYPSRLTKTKQRRSDGHGLVENKYATIPRRYFFCGSFMFLFCLVFAMFCARLFICASWSPAGKGLTSWLSFVVSSVSLSLSHWYPGSGVVLNCIDS